MKLILSLFIFSIFLFINKAAFAEWSLYGETDAGYHFINLDDTSSDDKYIYYWILTDYKEPQNNNLISNKFLSKLLLQLSIRLFSFLIQSNCVIPVLVKYDVIPLNQAVCESIRFKLLLKI